MRWVAIFEDDPTKLALRDDHYAEHFAYLVRHGDKIRVAGGLRQEASGPFCGGLWIIETETRQEAMTLCENDPYFTSGLRKSYRLYLWGKAPFYGEVIL